MGGSPATNQRRIPCRAVTHPVYRGGVADAAKNMCGPVGCGLRNFAANVLPIVRDVRAAGHTHRPTAQCCMGRLTEKYGERK
jgi:hypothetical protein